LFFLRCFFGFQLNNLPTLATTGKQQTTF
jgi:hypothetical protein